jgi:hypothetical protein
MTNRCKRRLWFASVLICAYAWPAHEAAAQVPTGQDAAVQLPPAPDAAAPVPTGHDGTQQADHGATRGPRAEAAAQSAPPPKAPPVAAEPSATEGKLEQKLGLRVYGMLKPTVVVANGVESFGAPNYVATTAAANPLFLPNPDAIGVSFQVAQTRFGLIVGEGFPLKATAEIDFVDFGKSSPAQSAIPRLRQAFLEWSINAHHKLTLGQLWDVFSPLNSHTYDLVGALFQSGNAGFMRHQIIYTGSVGRFEGVLALGMTNQNLQAALANVEYGRMPTVVARASYRADKTLWVGVAAMISRVSFDATLPTESTRIAAGGNAFADVTLGSVNLRADLYAGQNLNNLGMLVLGHGSAASSVAEAGGFVSAKHTFLTSHAVHLTAGAAFVFNADDLALGYTPAVPAMDTMPARAAARVGANGPGIERNITVRGGYAYSPLKGLSLVLEPFLMLTKHKLDAVATAQYDPQRIGYGVQFGGLYAF